MIILSTTTPTCMYLVPLTPDELLYYSTASWCENALHVMYTCERRICQRNREVLHSPKLKSVWTAALRRQNILQLFTDTTRFTKRHTIVSFSEFSGSSNKNCVPTTGRKSCCHEDREDSASPLFCLQFCSSPVHWRIFQSHQTKKGSMNSTPFFRAGECAYSETGPTHTTGDLCKSNNKLARKSKFLMFLRRAQANILELYLSVLDSSDLHG